MNLEKEITIIKCKKKILIFADDRGNFQYAILNI